ncbi:hypothetical protein BKA70DRAFT_1326027 [Coprinopsis sp. MPI-PUGE-AT-0042]|nr:hypothetical protein BKA70DRAFT_1326027 [Coprinopsis sp. MPI-PUGE-AT-0042]
MGQLNENESSAESITGEEPSFNNSGLRGIPKAPIITSLDDLPSQSRSPKDPASTNSEGIVQDRTVVDQLGGLLSSLTQFGNRFEQVYVRPGILLLLNALGFSQPIAQYLETPMTLAFFVTTLFFVVAILGFAFKEVLRLSALLLAYFVKRSLIFSFRLLKITIESILIFVSLSIVAAIGKAMLGSPIPGLSARMPTAEQLSNHVSKACEQLKALRTYASSADLRELAEQVSQSKANVGATAASLKGRFVEQKLWVKVASTFSAYMILVLIFGDAFHIPVGLVIYGKRNKPLCPASTLISCL